MWKTLVFFLVFRTIFLFLSRSKDFLSSADDFVFYTETHSKLLLNRSQSQFLIVARESLFIQRKKGQKRLERESNMATLVDVLVGVCRLECMFCKIEEHKIHLKASIDEGSVDATNENRFCDSFEKKRHKVQEKIE